jgi:hypothetical protein
MGWTYSMHRGNETHVKDFAGKPPFGRSRLK